jgi:hypothetical protein
VSVGRSKSAKHLERQGAAYVRAIESGIDPSETTNLRQQLDGGVNNIYVAMDYSHDVLQLFLVVALRHE